MAPETKPSPFESQIQQEKKKTFWYYNKNRHKYELIDITTGMVVSEKAELSVTYEYNPLVVDIICQKILEGGSLSQICGQPNMPSYAIFCRWRREHPVIESQLELARKDRAEALRDKALEFADDADEDNATSQKLKHDAYKWAAGIDDSRYSPKAKVEASVTMPTMIVLNTGIDRRQVEVNTGVVDPNQESKNERLYIKVGEIDTNKVEEVAQEKKEIISDGLDF